MHYNTCPGASKSQVQDDGSSLPLQDLLEHTGVTVDYRYKLTTPDIWETVVFTNKK